MDDELTIRALEGDVSGDAVITGGDFAAVKPYFGQLAVDVPFPGMDLDRNGVVTAGDAALIKARFGHTVPECP